MQQPNDYHSEDDLHLIVDSDGIGLDDLADLLAAVRSILFRSLIQLLKEKDNRDAINDLYESHRKFIEKRLRDSFFLGDYPYYRHFERDYQFNSEIEPPLFEEWTRYLTRRFPVEIRSVSFGSQNYGIYVAAMLQLAGPIDLNLPYSMVKDLTNKVVDFVRKGISSPKPNGHLNSIPEIVETLAKNSRITKLELKAKDDTINIKAEFQKKRP